MTFRSIIDAGRDEAIALSAPNRPAISYKDLRKHCDQIGRQLASQGLTNSDRVAIVLRNGPEMASAFLAVSSYMSAAPLNPTYKLSEYTFYLKDLKPGLVIVEENSTNPVKAAAANLSIPVVEAKVTANSLAGAFELFQSEADIQPANLDHEALVLHTSGTTSRPKIVPLLQKNIFLNKK